MLQQGPAHQRPQSCTARAAGRPNGDGGGAAAPFDGQGHGLVGMAERAAAFGGTVISGPRPSGGFRVIASIPIPHPDNSLRSPYE